MINGPLPVGVEEVMHVHHELGMVLRHPAGDVDEVAHEVAALTVELCADLRQSSPQRNLTSPFSSDCKMGKETAAKTSVGG